MNSNGRKRAHIPSRTRLPVENAALPAALAPSPHPHVPGAVPARAATPGVMILAPSLSMASRSLKVVSGGRLSGNGTQAFATSLENLER